MKWTDAQYDAINADGCGLLVSAAAGSGKTAVLVERVTRLVIEKETGLERMLIVTFTNAAAAEMKEKIYKSLTKALAQTDSGSDRAAYLRRQINGMANAKICTFHKFAMSILRDYYQVIGEKPGFSVCDDARRQLFLTESMNELFEDCFAKKDEDFLFLMDRYTDSKDDEALRRLISDFREFLQSLPYPGEWAEDMAEGRLFDTEAVIGRVRDDALVRFRLMKGYQQQCVDMLTRAQDPGSGSIAPRRIANLQADADGIDAVIYALENGSLQDGIDAVNAFKRVRNSNIPSENLVWNLVKDSIEPFRDNVKALLDDVQKQTAGLSREALETEKELMLPYLRALKKMAEELDLRYAAKKRAAGFIDYSDMEHFALKILENDRAAEEYRQQFDYIFIDEYQDSNTVQEELIRRISREDNLFMVGDVKQCIYRFRLADPGIFLGKYKSIKAGRMPSSRVIDLNSNFRSKAPVIDLVNGVYSVLMRPETTGIVYDEDAALREGAPYTGPYTYEPGLYLVERNLLEDEASGPAEGEASSVSSGGDDTDFGAQLAEELADMKAADFDAAQAVRLIKAHHGKTVIHTGDGDRPLEYRDMVILLPQVKGVGEIYYSALADAGIPVYMERNEGYFNTPEVAAVLNLLRIIDNGSKDVSLISVLRFPVFGFTDEELARIRIYADKCFPEKYRWPFYKAFGLYARQGSDELLRARCGDFLDKLQQWRRQSRYMPMGSFLWDLINDTGLLSFITALPGGPQRRANLRALVERAADFEAGSAVGLYGFISYIEAVKDKVDVGEVKIFSEDSDAVRIMTIHKSKGLEFPFVLLCGMNKKLSGNSGRGARKWAVYHKDMGCCMQLVNPKTGVCFKPAAFKLMERQQEAETLAEKIRLLYVAMTRPKDILYITAAVTDAAGIMSRPKKLPGDLKGASTYLDLLLFAEPRINIERVTAEDLSGIINTEKERRADLSRLLDEGFGLDMSKLPLSLEELRLRVDFDPRAFENSTQKRKYSVSQLAEIERLRHPELAPYKSSPAVPSFISPVRRLSGAARGTAYHTVMEHIPFCAEGKSPEDIAAFIQYLRDRFILDPREARSVDPARIAAFFSSDIGRRACRAEELYKESSFTLRELYEGREIMVQGTIDCCFLEDDKWVLVDYKSNYIDPEDIEEAMKELKIAYLPQLRQYRLALEKISGKTVKEAVLYLFGQNRELRIE